MPCHFDGAVNVGAFADLRAELAPNAAVPATETTIVGTRTRTVRRPSKRLKVVTVCEYLSVSAQFQDHGVEGAVS
jgi:hypothetical protein